MAYANISKFGLYVVVIGTWLAISHAQFPANIWTQDLRSQGTFRQPPLPTVDQDLSAVLITNGQRNQLNKKGFSGNNLSQLRGTSYNKRYGSRVKRAADESHEIQTEFSPLQVVSLLLTERGKKRSKRQAPGFQSWDFHPSSLVRRRLITESEQRTNLNSVPRTSIVQRSSTELSDNRKNINSKETSVPAVHSNNLLTEKQPAKTATDLNLQPADAHYNALLQQNKLPFDPHKMLPSISIGIQRKNESKPNLTSNSRNGMGITGAFMQNTGMPLKSNRNSGTQGIAPQLGPRYTNNGLQTQTNQQLQFDFTAAALVGGESGSAQQHTGNSGNKMPGTNSKNTRHPIANTTTNIMNGNDVLLDIKALNDLIDRTTRILMQNKGKVDTKSHQNTKSQSKQKAKSLPQNQIRHTAKSKKPSSKADNAVAKKQFQQEVLNVNRKWAQPLLVPQNQHRVLNTNEVRNRFPKPRQASMQTFQQTLKSQPEQKQRATSVSQNKPLQIPAHLQQNQKQNIRNKPAREPTAFPNEPTQPPANLQQNQQNLFNVRINPAQVSASLQQKQQMLLQEMLNAQDKVGQSQAPLQQSHGELQQLQLKKQTQLSQEQGPLHQNQQQFQGQTLNTKSKPKHVSVALQQNRQQNQQSMFNVQNRPPKNPEPTKQRQQQLEQHISRPNLSGTQAQEVQNHKISQQNQQMGKQQMFGNQAQPGQTPVSPMMQNNQQMSDIQSHQEQVPMASQQNQQLTHQQMMGILAEPIHASIPSQQNQQQAQISGIQSLPGPVPMPSQQNQQLTQQQMMGILTQPVHASIPSQQNQQQTQQQMLSSQAQPETASMSLQQNHQQTQQQMLGIQPQPGRASMSLQQNQQQTQQQMLGIQPQPGRVSMSLQQNQQQTQQQMLGSQAQPETASMSLQQNQQQTQQQILGSQARPGRSSMSLQQNQQQTQQQMLGSQVQPGQGPVPSQQQQFTQRKMFSIKAGQAPMPSKQNQQQSQQQMLGIQAHQGLAPMPSQQQQQLTQRQIFGTKAEQAHMSAKQSQQSQTVQAPIPSQQNQQLPQKKMMGIQTGPAAIRLQQQQHNQQQLFGIQTRQTPITSQQNQQNTQEQMLGIQPQTAQAPIPSQQNQQLTQQQMMGIQNEQAPIPAQQQQQQQNQQQVLSSQTGPAPSTSQQNQIRQQQMVGIQTGPALIPSLQNQQQNQQQMSGIQTGQAPIPLQEILRQKPQQILGIQTGQSHIPSQQNQQHTQQQMFGIQSEPASIPSQQNQQLTQQQMFGIQTGPVPTPSQKHQQQMQQQILGSQTRPSPILSQHNQQQKQQQTLGIQTEQSPILSTQNQQQKQQQTFDIQTGPASTPSQKHQQQIQQQMLGSQTGPSPILSKQNQQQKQQQTFDIQTGQAPTVSQQQQKGQQQMLDFQTGQAAIPSQQNQQLTQKQMLDTQSRPKQVRMSSQFVQTTSNPRTLPPENRTNVQQHRKKTHSVSAQGGIFMQDKIRPIHPTSNYQTKPELTPNYHKQQLHQTILSTPSPEKLILSFNSNDNRFHLHSKTIQRDSNKKKAAHNKPLRTSQQRRSFKRNKKVQGIPLPFDRHMQSAFEQVPFQPHNRQEKVTKEQPFRKESVLTGIDRQNRKGNRRKIGVINSIQQTTVSSANEGRAKSELIQNDAMAPANTVLENPLKPISLWKSSPDAKAGHPVAKHWRTPTRKIERRPNISDKIPSGRRNDARPASFSSSARASGSVKGGHYVKNWFNPRKFNKSTTNGNQMTRRIQSSSNTYDNTSSKQIVNKKPRSHSNMNTTRPGTNIKTKKHVSVQGSRNRKVARNGQNVLRNNQAHRGNSKQLRRQRGRSGRRPGNIGRSAEPTHSSENNINSSQNPLRPPKHQKRLGRRRNRPVGRRTSNNNVKPIERTVYIESTTAIDSTSLQPLRHQSNLGFDGSGEVIFDRRVHTTTRPPVAQTTPARSTTVRWKLWNQPSSNYSASSASFDSSPQIKKLNLSWNGNNKDIKQLNQSSRSDIKRNRTISITQKVRKLENETQASHAHAPINFNVFLGVPTTAKPQTKVSNTADVLRLLNALSLLRGNLGPPTTLLPPVKIIVQVERDVKPSKLNCRCFPKSDGCPSELKEEPLVDMCDVKDSIPCCEDG